MPGFAYGYAVTSTRAREGEHLAVANFRNTHWFTAGLLAKADEKTMQMEQMKNETLTDNTFPLSDFYLTAYLICRGMELLRAEPEGSTRVTFVLKDSPGRPKLIQEFYGHRAKIDPIAYKSVIIDLKSMIHNMKGPGRSKDMAI